MNRYENGRIYKIVDVGFNKSYIGSTCEKLSVRFNRHKWKYNSYKRGLTERTRSFDLFDEFGVDNCKIFLIENFPCSSKEELEAREGYYQEINECINKQLAGRSHKQWTQDNKEHLQKYKHNWYKNNEDKVKENVKRHKEENKEHYQEYSKKYREKHKEELKKKNKDYYENKKFEINEKSKLKIECPICSSCVRKSDLARHQKSKKCQSFQNNT